MSLSESKIETPLAKIKKIRFIVNPISGVFKKKNIEKRLEKGLNSHRFSFDVCQTEYAGHAIELSRQAVEDGCDIVVAVGGDGSLHEVIRHLVGTDVALGIIPAGSGNGFAMHAGVGRRINKAISILNEGHIRQIDTISLNGTPYINLSGLGFDAAIAYHFGHTRSRGLSEYARLVFREARQFPFYNVEIQLDDDEPFRRECLIVVAANSPVYGYNMAVAPSACIDDGKIEVMIFNKAPKWKYWMSFPKSLNNGIERAGFSERYKAKRLRVKIPDDSFIHMDGEGFKDSGMLDYIVQPASLNIILPPK